MDNYNTNLSEKKIRGDYGIKYRERTMYILLLLTTIILIFINYVFYSFIKIQKEKYMISIFLTLVVPIILNMYSIFFQISTYKKLTLNEMLKELEKQFNYEKESKVPVILFGLGLFITKLEKNKVNEIFPFLLISLLFGTIIPEIFSNLIFDHNNIERIIVFHELGYSSLMLSYGFLIMSVYLTYSNFNIR